MYMRAVTYRIVYLGVLSLGLVFGTAFRQVDVLAAPMQASPAQPVEPVRASAPVMLQTVHVRAQSTRATATLSPPAAVATTSTARAERSKAPDMHGEASLPTLRLDMPYYSLGKLLPRVGKDLRQ